MLVMIAVCLQNVLCLYCLVSRFLVHEDDSGAVIVHDRHSVEQLEMAALMSEPHQSCKYDAPLWP
jgi:hypothetical protein